MLVVPTLLSGGRRITKFKVIFCFIVSLRPAGATRGPDSTKQNNTTPSPENWDIYFFDSAVWLPFGICSQMLGEVEGDKGDTASPCFLVSPGVNSSHSSLDIHSSWWRWRHPPPSAASVRWVISAVTNPGKSSRSVCSSSLSQNSSSQISWVWNTRVDYYP